MDFTRMPVPHGFPQHMPPGDMGRPENMMNPNMIQQEHFSQVEGLYTGGATSTDADYREIHSVLVDQGERFGVSTVCFDDRQELLWMGNQGGHVTSYYGLDTQKYTSFQVHHTDEIRQIVPIERGILSLTQSSLKCSIRRGIPMFTYQSPSMQSMQCMLLTSPSSVLIGGHQTKVIELDLEQLQEINQFDVPEPGCAIFRRTNKFLCAGDAGGKVTLYDPKTMKAEHVLSAHSGALSDFDLLGNLLVTCGFSSRHGSLAIDRFLMVYDMRVMRAMAPISVITDPMFLRTIPAFSNTMLVVSQTGQFQFIDTTVMTPPMMMYPINTQGGLITSLDVSSTCQALSFGDSNGYLHLFTAGEHVTYNSFSQPTEFADPVEHLQPIHISDELTPLSIIPMMYPVNGTLLSDWPPELCQKVYRNPRPIDPDVLKTMKIQHNVGYAPNPGKERRNQIPYKLADEKSQKKKSGVPESPIGRGDDPFIIAPKKYRKVDLKYSKLGLEDFDFRHYNKTHFAGLETNIPNSYCNALLQTLFFIEPLRCALLSHLCVKEFCLSCELGFLFHMLDSQKGQTCQASNFLRAFRTIPEAAALGLILTENEENSNRVNLTRMIQSWQRFVLHQVHSEIFVKTQIEEPKAEESSPEQTKDKTEEEKTTEKASDTTPKSKKKKKKKGKKKGKETTVEEEDKEKSEDKDAASIEQTSTPPVEEVFEEKSVITDLFEISMVTTLKCRCGQETSRQSDTTIINLNYPDCSPPGINKPPTMYKFGEVVQNSLATEQTTQAWCNICERYQPHMQKKLINSLPDVLALNCGMENVRDVEFWKIQRMLLKQQKEESNDGSSASSSPIPITHNVVMCRYGRSCTRRGCKFRHEHDMGDGSDNLHKINPDDDPDNIWLPLGLKIVLSDDGSVLVTEISDEEPLPKIEEPNTKYYEMFATIAHIKDSKTAGNLVCQLKGGETYHQRKEGVTCTQWYLFNDFSISDIEKHEAIQFNVDWKVPCSIYFMKRNIVRYHKCQVVSPINQTILFEDSALVNPKKRKISFTPLAEDEEFPKKGDLVGLDAEFVSLNQEESELRSDGTRSMIKPSHLTVARISCIRGQGDKLGEPFIDDYISTQEQVVDYLTQFSGIQPGDLDPSVSTRHLTSLKSTYQKLRFLVDAGVVFVGHGLKKDFRVINITVPKGQVIDTVELFHLPRQRMISLKFLAWYFLNINIQAHTHDSVEDARTALNLYLKYKELQEEGGDKVRAAIKEMYEVGRKNQWKIPDLDENIDQDQLIDFSDIIGNG